jgi:hypothetical protein
LWIKGARPGCVWPDGRWRKAGWMSWIETGEGLRFFKAVPVMVGFMIVDIPGKRLEDSDLWNLIRRNSCGWSS